MVNGKRPQTQGDTDVSKPAPYIIGRDESKLLGSPFKLVLAKAFAVDSALNTISSNVKYSSVLRWR